MASLSCIIVLVVGNACGATVKGITGFGSAILNLCVWVVCTCLGIDAGTLQQAVVSECVCSEFCALPLLHLTKAGKTCDWRLVSALFVFGTLGAPVGAALLTGLPSRLVEFVMACVLLVVIGLHCEMLQQSKQWWRMHLASKYASLPSSNQNCHCEDAVRSCCHARCIHNQTISRTATASGVIQHDSDGDRMVIQQQPVEQTELVHIQQQSSSVSAVDLTEAVAEQRSEPRHIASQTLDQGGCEAADDAVESMIDNKPVSRCSNTYNACAEDCLIEIQTASGNDNSNCNDEAAAVLHGPLTGNGTTSCNRLVSWLWQPLQAWWLASDRSSVKEVVLFGSLAGSLGGIMQGMTGMGGPPLMFMYDKLQVDKDTVRGCNAVLNVLQVRVIAYIMTGAFTRDDIWLYVAVSVAGVICMYCGDRLAGRMNQAMFSKVLVALMCLCCVLMFAASAGLTASKDGAA